MKRFLMILLLSAIALTACAQEYGAVKPDDSLYVGESFGQLAYTAAFRSSDASLAAAFDQMIADMLADGTIGMICENYMGQGACSHAADDSLIPVYADAEDRALFERQKEGVITVGYQDQRYPLAWEDANGTVVGADADIAYEAARRLGLAVKFEKIDWKNIDSALESQNIDAFFGGFAYSDARASSYCLTRPYIITDITVVSCDPNGPKTLAELAGKRVGVHGGSLIEDLVASEIGEKQVMACSSNASAYYRMKEKKLDAIVVDTPFARYAADGHLVKTAG